MIIKVKVKPRSKSESVKKLGEGLYEVRVKAPPEKGKANERLLELLSKHLGVPRSALKILKGLTSKEKLIKVEL
ncbi:MAG: DUF167 domain-containing protein [Aquificae bacterium]|nr:DUF167 domain-containing protein [Aquificota bacterium]